MASGAEYLMEEQFQNLLIFGILIIFQIKKKIWIQKIIIWKISHFPNCYNWLISNIRNCSIWKINEFSKFNTEKFKKTLNITI